MLRKPILVAMLLVSTTYGRCACGSDLSRFLHALFDEHHQRSPTGTELNYHASIHRDQGALENYIALCGSDDFFISQGQRNLEVYVTRLYQVFLGRNPRADELRFWVVQFQQGGISRGEMVRRFCQANRITQLPSFLPSQPSYQAPATAAEIARELQTQIGLFVGLIRTELGLSVYGQRVIAEATKLATVTEQYRQVVQSNSTTQQQLQIAVANLERGLQRLETEYYRVPGASPQSQMVLQHISSLVIAARSAPVGRPEQPIARPPFAPPSGYAEVTKLRDVARQFAYGLQNYENRSPFYANLSRNMQGLLVQIESVELMMRQSQSNRRVRGAMLQVLTRADQLGSDFARADNYVQQGWWNVHSQVRSAARAIGVLGTVQAAPSAPVVINRPAWSGLPFQPVPSAPSRRNGEAIQLADELSGKIESYIASLRPAAVRNRDAQRLIGSLQNLQHAVAVFRQTAASGATGNTLTRSSDALMGQYQATATDVTQVVSRDSTLNSPLLYQIGELTQKLRYAAAGVRS